MLRFLLGIAFVSAVLLAACDREEDFITAPDAKLEFSLDTLRFDTVFTQVGSATYSFKVYNRHDRPIRISNIMLDGSSGTRFRLNVDGVPGNAHQNVEIYGRDSIYVFVEVTIDPNQPLAVSPFVIEDGITFETNGNTQRVLLEAWGQNANYFPSRYNKGVPVLLTCNNGQIVWDDPKPYVIYGVLIIDECTLVIPAGARVHVHGGVAQNDLFGIYNDGLIYTLANGKIIVQGTAEKPVIIQGDRLEEPFENSRGQWNGIIIGKGSRGNEINYASVLNSRFALLVDSSAEITLRNSRFYNTSGNGIVAFHSRITAENCLVYNNGANSVQLIFGGDYNFTYCTLANYGVNAGTLGMSNFYCYDDPLLCQNRRDYRINAQFVNSVIYGSRRDQIELADVTGRQTPAMFNVTFKDCVVRVDELLTRQSARYGDFLSTMCAPCTNGVSNSKVFKDPNMGDYYLDSLSIAIGKAKPLPSIAIDLENRARDAANPDAGCFERE